MATFVTAAAGYAFSKMKFRGSGWLFGIAIIVILVPKQALAVPLFEWMAWLGWQGELWSLVLPGVASGLGVIFFTQVFRKVPDELIDLAKVEGLNPVRIFLTLLPLIAPALVTFCFLHFILSWQEHLLPLLMLDGKLSLSKKDRYAFQFDELAIEVPALSEPLQESVVLGLRPENVLISSEPVAGGTWETKIDRIDELGDSRLMHLPLGSSGLIARSENRDLKVGMSLFVRPDWERVHWFAPSSGKRL